MLARRLTLSAPFCLAACATAQVQKSESDLGMTPEQAKNLWGIALGLAEVASLAVPQLVPVVAIAQIVVTPMLNDAAQTQAVVAQANALTIAAAPHITATANQK